jgi:hypothetical protein
LIDAIPFHAQSNCRYDGSGGVAGPSRKLGRRRSADAQRKPMSDNLVIHVSAECVNDARKRTRSRLMPCLCRLLDDGYTVEIAAVKGDRTFTSAEEFAAWFAATTSES